MVKDAATKIEDAKFLREGESDTGAGDVQTAAKGWSVSALAVCLGTRGDECGKKGRRILVFLPGSGHSNENETVLSIVRVCALPQLRSIGT